MTSESDQLTQRLAVLDSTVVSDALDGLGLPAGLGELRPVWGAPRVFGRVRTFELEEDPGGEQGPHLAAAVVAAANAGDVIVVANGGRLDGSCWGGILSLAGVRRRVAGVIVDGACRDVTEASALGLPVFSRGISPRTGRGRFREHGIGQRIRVGDVDVDEGDLAIADDSGVVFIPREHAQRVIADAERIQTREAAIAADVRGGVPVDEAMHDARLAGHSDGSTRIERPGDGEIVR
jgi:regulator of RNase E activity RraA